MRVDMRDEELRRKYWEWRVFLDGTEVTRECFMADDHPPGIVGLYLRDEHGSFYRQGDGVAHEFRRGKVTLIPPEAV